MSSQHTHTPKYYYYVPNEVIIYLEQNRPIFRYDFDTVESLARVLSEELNLKDNRQIKLVLDNLSNNQQRGMHFRRTEKSSENFQPFTSFLLRWEPEKIPGGPRANPDPIEIVNRLNELFIEELNNSGAEDMSTYPLRPVHALLNWYAGGATHTGLGTHGPGRPPRPVIRRELLEQQSFIVEGDLGDALKTDPDCNCEAEGVNVYILDTIPQPGRMVNAWYLWGEYGIEAQTLQPFKSILLPMSLQSPGIYTTEAATYIYANAMGQDFDHANTLEADGKGHYWHPLVLRSGKRNHNHDGDHGHSGTGGADRHQTAYRPFDTSDHGLFIAGIIHRISPGTKLCVLEVLNQFGVGTFLNIAAGFQKVAELQDKSPRKAVINCSFTLTLPRDEKHQGRKPTSEDFGLQGLSDDELDMLIEAASEMLERVRLSVEEDALIIGAAGNDSDRQVELPKAARSLANKEYVVGVGALKKNSADPANYSNDADQPRRDGFMIFGGDYDDTKPPQNDKYDDDGNGVIGIFTLEGNFDINGKNVENRYGYAEWAGTSFAAPMLTGIVAQLYCAMSCDTADRLSPLTILETIKALTPAGKPKGTQDKAWVIREVTQKKKERKGGNELSRPTS